MRSAPAHGYGMAAGDLVTIDSLGASGVRLGPSEVRHDRQMADKRKLRRRGKGVDWNAFVAALAVLLASAIGAAVAVIVSNNQASTTDRSALRELEEALRERRQVAYAEFVVESDQSLRTIYAYWLAEDPTSQDPAALETARNERTAAYVMTLFVGGDKVDDAAHDLKQAADVMEQDVLEVSEPGGLSDPEIESRFEQAFGEIGEFLEVASAEVG